jgi:hypothetical protein
MHSLCSLTASRRYRRAVRRLAVLLAITFVAGCRPDTVAVSFRPAVGALYRYEIRVHAVSTTALEGRDPERKDEQVRLVSEHTVLDAGKAGVRVRVLVGEPGELAQSFVVRFDRAAQLRSVESAEGAAPDIVGALGVPEIAPGATGAPPGRRLAPGDSWDVVRRVAIPGSSRPARLHTHGTLRELGIEGDEEVARLRSTTDLPIEASTSSELGTLDLSGAQRIVQRVTYDLDDGSVRRATATTTGRFTIRLLPPTGETSVAIPGTLIVRVTSTTRRLS